MIYEYIVHVMQHNVSPYVEGLRMHRDDFGQTHFNYGEADTQNTVCENLPSCQQVVEGFACRICKIIVPILGELVEETAQCLSKYSDTDFEDGVKWIECFYTCR